MAAHKETGRAGVIARFTQMAQAPSGSVRACTPYAGELARHRLVSADGQDYVVTTYAERAGKPVYITGAYPVSRGYLVMLKQPLYEVRSENDAPAHMEHEQLVRALAELGAKVVKARRILANRRRAERADASREPISLIERRAAHTLADTTQAVAL